AGFALMTASVRFFLENGETLLPKTPSTALLQEGPFARSRNPIYLGMVAIGCGLGFATSNVFMVALAYVGGVILNYFVIAPEEAYLEKQFGAEYTDYKARVRRWI
ncbi:MAG: isoprenylcysteine carboxylmethyltransferase family protein, partial [Pseudomonadota bacterium]